MWKKILILLAVLVAAGAFIGYLQYNKPHKDIQQVKADYRIQAQELFAAFEADETAANEKYLGKVIEVVGLVESVKTNEAGVVNVMLDSGSEMAGVLCELDQIYSSGETTIQEGQTVSLRGICSGSLLDVVLVRCVVL